MSRVLPPFGSIDAHVGGLAVRFGRCDQLHGREHTVQRPPAFVLGRVPSELSLHLMAGFETGPVSCYRLSDAMVTIDGIIMHEGVILTSDTLNFPAEHVRSMLEALPGSVFDLPRQEVSGSAVLMMGPGPRIFGHWLVDMLPRLFVLSELGLDLGSLRYIVPDRCTFVQPLLGLFGIGPDQLIAHDDRSQSLAIEELLVPTNLRLGGRFHREMARATNFLADRMRHFGRPGAPVTAPGPLFVARRSSGQERELRNRAAIEAMAEARGFRVVVPETLPLAEQFALFSCATVLAGEYGSGLHHSLFAPEGTPILAIRGNSIHPGFIQSGIGEIRGQPTGYVLCETPLHAITQDFQADESMVAAGFAALDLLAVTRP